MTTKSGYKQATKSDLASVVKPLIRDAAGKMLDRMDEGDRATKAVNGRVSAVVTTVTELKTAVSNLASDLSSLEERRAANERQTAKRFATVADDAHDLGDKQAHLAMLLANTDKRLAALQKTLDGVVQTQKEIQETLIASREQAINRLAHSLSKAVLTVLNETSTNR